MAVSIEDEKLLKDLEAMGFPLAKATNALQYAGNCSLEDAIKWITEHETEPKIDEMPLSLVHKIATLKPDSLLTEHAEERKADESRKEYLKRKRHYETHSGGKRAKEKHQIVARRPEAETLKIQVESTADSQKRENDEVEKVATMSVKKLEEDMHRQLSLGLPSKNPLDKKHAHTTKLGNTLPSKYSKRIELLRECLRSIKGNYQGDEDGVKTTFNTLSIYVRNILKNPHEEKFKRIRVANPNFQSRVGRIREGIEFLHLCGFEWTKCGDFLHLPCNKVDPALLNSAGTVLDSALSNRFFGMLSKKIE